MPSGGRGAGAPRGRVLTGGLPSPLAAAQAGRTGRARFTFQNIHKALTSDGICDRAGLIAPASPSSSLSLAAHPSCTLGSSPALAQGPAPAPASLTSALPPACACACPVSPSSGGGGGGDGPPGRCAACFALGPWTSPPYTLSIQNGGSRTHVSSHFPRSRGPGSGR